MGWKMSGMHDSTAFQHRPDGRFDALDRALALQNPHSFEYKMLMDLYEVIVEKEELSEQLLVQMIMIQRAEEQAIVNKNEARLLREKEQKKLEAAQSRNEEIKETQRETVKAAISEQVKDSDQPNNYEQQIAAVDAKIEYKNKEISELEKSWKETLGKTADKFIEDNFKLNENGKYTSVKNPAIELLDTAIETIKKVFTDAKSPAELQKHNPHLINHPERMLTVDDVRKEIRLAKKIDEIVDKHVKDTANEKRKIIVKRIVLDKDGNPEYEVVDGKRKVKTERIELTPETMKLKDDLATDESTKKKKLHLVCLGDVCFLQKNVMSSPIQHA